MRERNSIQMASPKGAPAGVFLPGVILGRSLFTQTLTVANNAITTLTLQGATGLIRLTSLAQAIFVKKGAGVDKAAWAKAVATFTVEAEGVISDGEKIEAGGKEYTFVAALSEDPTVENEVLIETLVADTLDNLKLAIIAAGTEGEIGVKYSVGTTPNELATATTNSDTAQVVEALVAGDAGNTITVSTDCADASWGSEVTTLSGGNSTLFDEYIKVGETKDIAVEEGIDSLTFIGDGGSATVHAIEY